MTTAETTINPAMTREEWNTARFRRASALATSGQFRAQVEGLHARAALALYEQPFGFTRSDVSLLTSILARLGEGGRRHAQAESLRERITALLPPE